MSFLYLLFTSTYISLLQPGLHSKWASVWYTSSSRDAGFHSLKCDSPSCQNCNLHTDGECAHCATIILLMCTSVLLLTSVAELVFLSKGRFLAPTCERTAFRERVGNPSAVGTHTHISRWSLESRDIPCVQLQHESNKDAIWISVYPLPTTLYKEMGGSEN